MAVVNTTGQEFRMRKHCPAIQSTNTDVFFTDSVWLLKIRSDYFSNSGLLKARFAGNKELTPNRA